MDEINEAAANTLTSYQINLGAYARNATEDYLDSVVQWQKSRNIIGSKLDLYYPDDTQIRSNWKNLSNAIEAIRGIVSGPSPGEYGMCYKLGRVLEVQAVYSTQPLNIDPDVMEAYHCDRYAVSSLQNSSHLKKVFPLKDGEINWNVTTKDDEKDGEINWNALFLRHYTSKTPEGITAAHSEFGKNYEKLEKRINDDKAKLLTAVIESNIRAFE